MSSKRLDKISDYARHGYVLHVQCRQCRQCGHEGKLDPASISAQAVYRGWSRDLGAVASRLRCRECGSRLVRCGPSIRDKV